MDNTENVISDKFDSDLISSEIWIHFIQRIIFYINKSTAEKL